MIVTLEVQDAAGMAPHASLQHDLAARRGGHNRPSRQYPIACPPMDTVRQNVKAVSYCHPGQSPRARAPTAGSSKRPGRHVKRRLLLVGMLCLLDPLGAAAGPLSPLRAILRSRTSAWLPASAGRQAQLDRPSKTRQRTETADCRASGRTMTRRVMLFPARARPAVASGSRLTAPRRVDGAGTLQEGVGGCSRMPCVLRSKETGDDPGNQRSSSTLDISFICIIRMDFMTFASCLTSSQHLAALLAPNSLPEFALVCLGRAHLHLSASKSQHTLLYLPQSLPCTGMLCGTPQSCAESQSRATCWASEGRSGWRRPPMPAA